MPGAEKHDVQKPAPESLEGTVFENTGDEAFIRALQTAFDYRGDATLVLEDGSQIEGYIFNHNPATREIQVFVKEGKESAPAVVPYGKVKRILLSGPDMAFGKSWDDWTKKDERERKKLAERLAGESQALGHL
jgi:hypothetical protein